MCSYRGSLDLLGGSRLSVGTLSNDRTGGLNDWGVFGGGDSDERDRNNRKVVV